MFLSHLKGSRTGDVRVMIDEPRASRKPLRHGAVEGREMESVSGRLDYGRGPRYFAAAMR